MAGVTAVAVAHMRMGKMASVSFVRLCIGLWIILITSVWKSSLFLELVRILKV